jgi:hypothetical protein
MRPEPIGADAPRVGTLLAGTTGKLACNNPLPKREAVSEAPGAGATTAVFLDPPSGKLPAGTDFTFASTRLRDATDASGAFRAVVSKSSFP